MLPRAGTRRAKSDGRTARGLCGNGQCLYYADDSLRDGIKVVIVRRATRVMYGFLSAEITEGM